MIQFCVHNDGSDEERFVAPFPKPFAPGVFDVAIPRFPVIRRIPLNRNTERSSYVVLGADGSLRNTAEYPRNFDFSGEFVLIVRLIKREVHIHVLPPIRWVVQ